MVTTVKVTVSFDLDIDEDIKDAFDIEDDLSPEEESETLLACLKDGGADWQNMIDSSRHLQVTVTRT